MKIYFSAVPLEIILLAKDYYESEYKKSARLNYFEGGVEINCENDAEEKIFLDEMHDFFKRIKVFERTKTLKEIIVGRALYGNLN